MISQIAFTQMVDVQSETIERYIREGKIKPDMEVPVSEHKSFRFFKKEKTSSSVIVAYAAGFNTNSPF